MTPSAPLHVAWVSAASAAAASCEREAHDRCADPEDAAEELPLPRRGEQEQRELDAFADHGEEHQEKDSPRRAASLERGRDAALQLGTILAAVTLTLLLLERASRGRARYSQDGGGRALAQFRLARRALERDELVKKHGFAAYDHHE